MIRAGVVAGVLVSAMPAAAQTWRGQAEAGAEYDSNVRRVEDHVGVAAAPMLRAHATVAARGGQVTRWSLAVAGGTRAAMTDAVRDEDAVTGAIDATAARSTSEHVALSTRATHYEVFPVDGAAATRAFASSGVDLGAAIADDRDRTATVTVGARRLQYKPDPNFDWTGPALTLALAQPLWRGEARTLDLSADYRLERRSYRGLAYRNGCLPGVMLETRCFVPGDRARADLVQVASAHLTYTGLRAASLGYELTVADSTSFGSSFVRHRVSGSITSPLVARVFATASLAAQLDRFAEPQLVARDVANQSFTSLDDEARSSAAVRLGRSFGAHWQAELRWSYHLSALAAAAGYHRQVVYGGVTWER